MRQIILAILVIFTVSACALGNQSAREIEITVIPMEETEDFDANATASAEAFDTPTLMPTPTPLPTDFAPQATVTPVPPPSIRNTDNCTVRDDLPTHSVVAGDTLSSIASLYNSTSNQLAEFNCLTDSNLIRVGMSLYVPIQATVTFTPTPFLIPEVSSTPQNLGVRGTLSVHPAETFPPNWSDYFVEAGIPVTISWTGIEPEYYVDIVSVVFYFTPSVGASTQLGIDANMSDGMSLTWTPYGSAGSIVASASTIDNGFWMSSALQIRMQEASQAEATENLDN